MVPSLALNTLCSKDSTFLQSNDIRRHFSLAILAAADDNGCSTYVCDQAGVARGLGCVIYESVNATLIDLKSSEYKYCPYEIVLAEPEDVPRATHPILSLSASVFQVKM